MSRSYSKRTRTGFGTAQGGLRDYIQQWMITLLHPDTKNTMKIEISSQLRPKDKEKKSREYMSLRFEDLTTSKTFLISLLLAMREYAKYAPDESVKDLKNYLEKVPDIVFSGHFDDRMQVYGYSQENRQQKLLEEKEV